MKCFITSTDTGVGKTYVTCALIRSWITMGHQPAAFKPISTGTREDGELLREAANNALSLNEVNPYHLNQPLSPWIAASLESKKLAVPAIAEKIRHSLAPFSHVAVEGTGGWLTPVNPQATIGDLARELGFPVIIVTRATVGTLNHTLLTVESIRAAGLPVLGLIVNHHGAPEDLSTWTNPLALAQFTGLPYLSLQDQEALPLPLPTWLGGVV